MDTSAQPEIIPATPTRCPLTAALEAVGGRWALITLYWLKSEPHGFNDLQRHMPNISHKVLSDTLRDLETHQLITREIRSHSPLRVEYALSAHGATAMPLVEAMRSWGHVHMRR
jgi:DNA-binding HxlR family transcriptional regulator